MEREKIEWVVLSSDTAIVATGAGQVWFQALGECPEISPFSVPMTGEGSPQTTALLLNGAVELVFRKYGCEVQESLATLPKYVFNLVCTYHNSSRTPGHYRQAANRFREIGRPEVADYLEKHAREETGHDRLALKDLRALNLEAERLIENLIPEGMKTLCDLFDRLSSEDYPIGCIGYSYCFESTAALKQKSDVGAMQALCPEGVDASRFMRSHSSLGKEVEHVEDLVNFIAGLPAADRIAIVQVTYETAILLAECLHGEGRMTDEEILAQLEAAAGEPIQINA